MIGRLRDITHSSQSGMYALAGIMVAGALAVWRVPAKLCESLEPLGWNRIYERTYTRLHRR